MSSSSNSDPSSSSHEDQTAPRPQTQIQARVKEPVIDFVVGGHLVRDMLPSQVLPRELNPRLVDCRRPDDLPVVWYGVEFDQGKVLRYAVSRECGIRVDVGGVHDDLKTWMNFLNKYYEKSGLYLRLREVWGCNMHVLTFYSNRDLPRLTMKHRNWAIKTMLAMGYDGGDIHWWLDLGERV